MAEGHMSYCNHLASFVVVRHRQQFFKTLLLWLFLTNWNQTWYECFLGYRTWNIELMWGFLIHWKNMATVIENRTYGLDSSFLYISPQMLGLTKIWQDKSVQHDKIHLWSIFFESVKPCWSYCLFSTFFAIFNVVSFKNLLLWHYMTNWNQTWNKCF